MSGHLRARVCRVCGGEPLPPSARKGRLCKSCLRDHNRDWGRYYKGKSGRPPTAESRDPDYVRRRGEEFAELYESGKSLRDIAKIVGYSLTAVVNSIKAAGVKLRGKNGLTEEALRHRGRRRKDVVRRYARGEGLHHIASELGVGHMTVRSDLKAEGVELRRRTGAAHRGERRAQQEVDDAMVRWAESAAAAARAVEKRRAREERKDRAAELYRSGRVIGQIEDELGRSRGTIVRYLRERGVVMRTGGDAWSAATREKINADRRARLERAERYQALARCGWTLAEIGEVLGVPKSTIGSRLRGVGLRLGQGANGYHPTSIRGEAIWERRRKVARLYEKGETLTFIAFNLDIHLNTVNDDLKAAGVVRNRGGFRAKLRAGRVRSAELTVQRLDRES